MPERKYRSRFTRDLDVEDRGLEPGDILSIESIHDHYILPSNYIHELIKGTRRNPFGNRRRLRYMADTGYIERPDELNPFPALAQSIWYSIGDADHKGWAVLGEKKNQYSQMPGGGYRHNAGTCIVTANIHIGANADGFRYRSQEKILREAPESTRVAKKPLAIPTSISYTFKDGHTESSFKPTIPDELFDVWYGEDGGIIYLVEFARGTESSEPTRLEMPNGDAVNSDLRKFLSYKNIIQNKAAIKRFLNLPAGAPEPDVKVLFVYSSESDMLRAHKLAERIWPNGSFHILFNFVPGFNPFDPSPDLFPYLWDGPWIRPRKEPFYLNKP